MIDGLPTVVLSGGPWVLVSLAVVMVFTGQLVPGREMRYWRKAFFAEQALREQMTETGKATRDVLRAIPPAPPEESTTP